MELAISSSNRKPVYRGAQIRAPYPSPQPEPAEPLFRNDPDYIRQALPAGDAPLLDKEQALQPGLAHGVLHDPAADAGERGDRVDGKDADPGALTLAGDDRQDGQLGHRERGGDLRWDDPAHGLAPAPLEGSLPIG